MSRCVIFGGGDVLDYSAVNSQLRSDDFIICADSGYRHCEVMGIRPNLLMGDFDSIDRIPEGIHTIQHNPEKDYTDSTLAAEHALGLGATEILFVGMTGSRLDHSLGNLQLMAHCSRRANCRMSDGKTDVYTMYANGGIIRKFIAPRAGCCFSVLALSQVCEGVNIRGAKYALDDYSLAFDYPRAISNEFMGGDAEISLTHGVLLVVVTPED